MIAIIEKKAVEILIDDDDLGVANKYNWIIVKARMKKEKYYLTYSIVENGKRRTLYLHRLIMNAQKGQIVDHINGNSFDNRKCNLRFVTASENRLNSSVRTDSKSKIKGVYRIGKNSFAAAITINGKTFYLGRFENAELAHNEYMKHRQKQHGQTV